MSTENLPHDANRNDPAPIADADLAEVNGGKKYHDESTGKYYEWRGNDLDEKYLCPNCRRPVHFGSWLRYYCDPCNGSWLYESSLIPNIAGGSWKEISKEEYDTNDCPFPFA